MARKFLNSRCLLARDPKRKANLPTCVPHSEFLVRTYPDSFILEEKKFADKIFTLVIYLCFEAHLCTYRVSNVFKMDLHPQAAECRLGSHVMFCHKIIFSINHTPKLYTFN